MGKNVHKKCNPFLGPIVLYRPNAYNNKTAFIDHWPDTQLLFIEISLKYLKNVVFCVCVLSGSAVRSSTGNRGVARSPPASGKSAGTRINKVVNKLSKGRRGQSSMRSRQNGVNYPYIGHETAHTDLTI